jgi:hypothetical protein
VHNWTFRLSLVRRKAVVTAFVPGADLQVGRPCAKLRRCCLRNTQRNASAKAMTKGTRSSFGIDCAAMDYFPMLPFMFLAGIFGLLQVAWYIAVIVFLYKIWQRVKRLPV